MLCIFDWASTSETTMLRPWPWGDTVCCTDCPRMDSTDLVFLWSWTLTPEVTVAISHHQLDVRTIHRSLYFRFIHDTTSTYMREVNKHTAQHGFSGLIYTFTLGKNCTCIPLLVHVHVTFPRNWTGHSWIPRHSIIHIQPKFYKQNTLL